MEHEKEIKNNTQSKIRLIAGGIVILALVGAAIFLYIQSTSVQRAGDEKPSFQEKLAKTSERIAVRELVQKFMAARIEKNEDRAFQYLTERAVAALETQNESEFNLSDNFEKYKIISMEEKGENQFRVVVKVFEAQIFVVEFITVIKTLDVYFVDSVELAG